MVVEQHFAGTRDTRQRQHLVHPAARHDTNGRDRSLPIHGGDEGDFVATGGADLSTQGVPYCGCQALVQVFSSFFFAAGKRTLLRISR